MPTTFKPEGLTLDSYKLHIAKVPRDALFWALTAHNVTDGTMTAGPQLIPSINGMSNVKTNANGSVDLFVGPTKPVAAPDTNCKRQSVPRDNSRVHYGNRVLNLDLETG